MRRVWLLVLHTARPHTFWNQTFADQRSASRNFCRNEKASRGRFLKMVGAEALLGPKSSEAKSWPPCSVQCAYPQKPRALSIAFQLKF